MHPVVDAAGFEWRSPIVGDRPALERFACTTPDRRTYFNGRRSHPRPWELTAQTAIRTMSLRPQAPMFALLAWDDARIAAASIFEVDRSPFAGVGLAWMFAVGVSVAHRDYDLGDALLDRSIDRMVERAVDLGLTELLVSGKVHKKNQPCQGLLLRHDWDVTAGESGEQYDQWSATVLVPTVT